MARSSAAAALAAMVLLPSTSSAADTGRGAFERPREAALLQTWGQALNSAADTPVTRVVKLLKQMQTTLKNEMDEDAELYDKLACWCNTNGKEKQEAIEAAEAKISELKSNIDSLTARTGELKETIKQLDDDVASSKQALAEATELREKEAKEFHGTELEAMANIDSLKQAINVLEKHHGAALPQLSLDLPQAMPAFLAVRGKGRRRRQADDGDADANSDMFGATDDDHESRMARAFDDFLSKNGFMSNVPAVSTAAPQLALVKEHATVTSDATWSDSDTEIVKKALKRAAAFMQAKHSEDYYPSYNSQSGEIVGVLKELKDQMTADLSEVSKAEMEKKEAFEDLRKAKSTQIDAAYKQSEQKEDELAKASMELAESKEDLEQTEASLTEEQKFLMNMKSQCQDADANFQKRKEARLAEIQAVSETISILSSDETRDTLSRTYSFLQVVNDASKQRSSKAAALLRDVARKTKSPELSIMATNVQLDSFGRVKKAIDDMTAMLKTQQEDEKKKHDWCNGEFHDNEMATTKTEDRKSDLSGKIDELGMSISKFHDELEQAKRDIATLQVELQRATENRQKENMDFQTTVADQRATQAVLKKALEKLAEYYDKEGELLQTKQKTGQTQTPPVPQKEYQPSAASGGVMQMIEKLISEAKELEADSKASEMQAQAQYETLVADTNANVDALTKEVAFKTSAKAEATKSKAQSEMDLKDTVDELEGLSKYNGELHQDCDYLVKNFGVRQEARAQEIEALQQAKQILSGADLAK